MTFHCIVRIILTGALLSQAGCGGSGSNVGLLTGRVYWDQGIPVPQGTVVYMLGTFIGVTLGADGKFRLQVPANLDYNSYSIGFRSNEPGLQPVEGNPVIITIRHGEVADLGSLYPWPTGAITGKIKFDKGVALPPNVFTRYVAHAAGTGSAARADVDGNFLLVKVAAGRRDIVIRDDQMNVQTFSVLVQPGKLTDIDLTLAGVPHP